MLNAGVGHDDDLIGEFEGFFLVVGDEEGGEADLVVELAEPEAEFFADFGVEGAEGLVEEEDFGVDGEGAGEGDALALSAGEFVGEAIGEAWELDEIEEVLDAGVDFVLGGALVFGEGVEAEGDVLGDAHVLEQGVVLEDEADAAFAGVEVGDVLVVEGEGA